MDLNLCKQCDMKLNYYVSDEDSKLYLGCKVCGHKEEHTGTTCIYNNDYRIDLSQIINQNKYLEHDITLPTIENNPNIKCPNEECNAQGGDKSFKYIKYNVADMKYIYICEKCGQKWNN